MAEGKLLSVGQSAIQCKSIKDKQPLCHSCHQRKGTNGATHFGVRLLLPPALSLVQVFYTPIKCKSYSRKYKSYTCSPSLLKYKSPILLVKVLYARYESLVLLVYSKSLVDLVQIGYTLCASVHKYS